MQRLGESDLLVSELCLGGNVFGWTVDRTDAFALLDAYVETGGNFIDTADVYSVWVPGNSGGESETILGEWMAARDNRDDVVIASKIGQKPDRAGLTHDTMVAAVDESLERLQTDYIDLMYAHFDDQAHSLEETLTTFDELVKAGKVRQIAASNYGAARLREALDLQAREGLAPYVALQPPYNLVRRGDYEGELAALCAERDIACLPYYGLANGFLTGKYRSAEDANKSVRGGGAAQYLEGNGAAVLATLDKVAAAHKTNTSAVALAWLAAKPTVVAPIASARTTEQLAEIVAMRDVALSAAELAELDAVSA